MAKVGRNKKINTIEEDKEFAELQSNLVDSLTSNSSMGGGGGFVGTIGTTTAFPSTYIHQPNYTYPGTYTTPYVDPVPDLSGQYVEDVVELAALLGVQPGGTGIMFTGKDGQQYSLLAIVKAHIELMLQLNIFAAKKGTNVGE